MPANFSRRIGLSVHMHAHSVINCDNTSNHYTMLKEVIFEQVAKSKDGLKCTRWDGHI